MKFNASKVSLTKDENDVWIIGFIENESYANYVIIQYSNDVDEQELSLNWSKYYLELSNFGGSYNCISKINLTKNNLEIILNDSGSKKFNTNQILVYYSLNDLEYKNLLEELKTIFEDENDVTFNVIT
ncbi:Immunity protein 10 [Pseudarcicella hirudinis]|uniref:Immunity protein 10 n=1 Tax=Pseudarcicella hirudinis TaxID=1079859 RepID=A0A1I5RT52_9BACT|nr:Imm10 family immunity protein [Pseudarcicella hirudinis]SFP61749.1 Immunity protein 10 [Pseudarcicella hirudinis]